MYEQSIAVRSDARGSGKPAARSKTRSNHPHTSVPPQPSVNVIPVPPAEFAKIRAGLQDRFDQLSTEYRNATVELRALQIARQSDTSGDDQADTGNKTFEREQELTLAHGILERVEQVERAIGRIDDGTYGQCERCSNQIPIARLEAYPAATLCVTCKQRQERR
ncbi:MAG: conjugal transfer protein TraR [Acidimicrobiales bacterium]|nr:MAG: conjugal transfer protein TraR [Acidimicrobiales bacterium]